MKLFFATLLALTLSSLAEAKNGVFPTRTAEKSFAMQLLENGPATAGKLIYFGGPIVENVRVVAVYWGPNVAPDIKSGIDGFYSALVQSDLMTWMDQYNTFGKSLDGRDGTNQHIGKGSYVGAKTINPAKTSGTIDDSEIQAELQKQIDAGSLPRPDKNTMFMIYLPPGLTATIEGMKSCSEFCAYHNAKGAANSDYFTYGVMPDLGGNCSFSCGFGDHFANVTAISTHEFCEAVTDPFPTPGSNPAYPQAWNNSQGAEVGDLCTTRNTMTTGSGKSYSLQAEFDNTTGACTTRNWRAP